MPGVLAVTPLHESRICIYLHLKERPYIDVRLSAEPTAQNVDGLNIFGEKFGNYPQPIVLKVNFEYPENRNPDGSFNRKPWLEF